MSISITATTSETSVTASSTATTVTVSDPTISLAETVSLTGFSAGNLLDLSGSTFNVDLSELTDMTDSVVGGTDELVLLDNSVQRRKLFSEVGLSSFNNDLTITTLGTIAQDSVELVSTDAGATVNPILSLYRNSASPAVSDDLGAIQFYGEDDGDNKTLYAQIHATIEDETGGTEDGQIHFSCTSGASLEDPTMILSRSSLQMQANNDIILEQNSNIRFEGSGNNANETTFFVEDPTADRAVNLPDASGVLEIGALASGAVITGTSIAHATFSTYKGQKIVFTGSGNCTIGLPDAASGDIGSTWTVCNAGSANVIFDLDASAAQTVKILTGAAVTDVGTDNPHIIPGGVASIVCTAVDNYVLFGSGVVDN